MFYVNTLQELEKISLKCDKASLDIKFLLTCKIFDIVPKLIDFNLPYTKHNDKRGIRRRLLWSAINKRQHEKLKTNVRSLVPVIHWHMLYSIDNNVCKRMTKTLPTQEKHLKNVAFNIVIPFTSIK